jgi:pyruvate dehydrogenase E2 component (dihydrolipoamide acetyltransferase)
MPDIRTFRLPDLGEGLPDATIVEWLVKVGDPIILDAPLLSMETAKAVVEVPSPYSGKLVKVYGANGDVIATGAALADFEIDANVAQRAEAEATGHHSAAPAPAPVVIEQEKPDSGTVVGAMETSNRLVNEAALAVGGVKAVPAVRALAKKLNVDLAKVVPSGADGVVTSKDVKDAAASGLSRTTAKQSSSLPPGEVAARSAAGEGPDSMETADSGGPSSGAARHPGSSPGQALPPTGEGKHQYGEPMQVKGARRNMARVMADAQAKVVLTTIFDDADIQAWRPGNDISVRLLRAIVAACKAVPALNAWFDGDNLTRTLHSQVDIGIAVDTADGLFVPALRNVDVLDAKSMRAMLDNLLKQVRDRSIAPQELTGYTISLSNFGVFAGRYATPIVVPPCVAIVAAGKLRHDVVAVMGAVETHRVMPLSLSFDHRAVTGGEAARFLQALIGDLALSN